MIGFLLYETVDILYYVSKIGYNGINYIYKWYYNLNEDEKQNLSDEQIQLIECKMKEIDELIKTFKTNSNN
jgi:hypothetical protein